jgi:signal peptidase I
MEITTSPHRPAATPWARLVALVIIIAPVSILALLPIGLGMERYVMSGDSMDGGADGGIAQGAIVFERQVPVGDLRVGDVVTYRPPESADMDRMVTHRIVDIGPDGIVTKGDAEATPDPWVLHPDDATLPRVVATLPWIGYAYLLFLHLRTGLLLAFAGVAGVLLAATELSRRRGRTPTVAEGIATGAGVLSATAPAGLPRRHGRREQ